MGDALETPMPPIVRDPDDLDYEAPPTPPNVSPDFGYLAQVMAGGTRAILRDNRRRHNELLSELRAEENVRDPGLTGWLSAQLGKLHPTVQASLAMALVYGFLQLVGAGYEHLTGHAPPQPTQPVSMTATTPLAGP